MRNRHVEWGTSCTLEIGETDYLPLIISGGRKVKEKELTLRGRGQTNMEPNSGRLIHVTNVHFGIGSTRVGHRRGFQKHQSGREDLEDVMKSQERVRRHDLRVQNDLSVDHLHG